VTRGKGAKKKKGWEQAFKRQGWGGSDDGGEGEAVKTYRWKAKAKETRRRGLLGI